MKRFFDNPATWLTTIGTIAAITMLLLLAMEVTP